MKIKRLLILGFLVVSLIMVGFTVQVFANPQSSDVSNTQWQKFLPIPSNLYVASQTNKSVTLKWDDPSNINNSFGKIYYIRADGGNGTICEMNYGGTTKRDVTGTGYASSMVISPDGKYIFAAGTTNVVKINISTGEIETLANNPWQGSSAIFGGIAVSLNKVYYIRADGGSGTICEMNYDGTAKRDVTGTGYASSMVVSPDGKYIFAAGTTCVVKINISTGEIETLANNPWQGSSAIFGGVTVSLNKVYYIRADGGNGTICEMNYDGTAKRDVTGTGYASSIVMSPDGKYIFAAGTTNVVKINISTGEIKALANNPWCNGSTVFGGIGFTSDLISGYEILRNGEVIGTSNSNTYTDIGLKLGNTYIYTVRSYDLSGYKSPVSEAVSVILKLDKVYYIRADGGSGTICEMNYDGTAKRDVTGTGYASSIVISPDGKYIFAAGTNKVVGINISTGEIKTLANNPWRIGSTIFGGIAVSLNKVYYIRADGGNGTICEMNYDGTAKRDVTSTGYASFMVISPDGKYIFAAGTNRVVKINISTGEIKTLANNPWRIGGAIFGGIAVSLNKVYYIRADGGSGTICEMNYDGTAKRDVTGAGYASSMVISPDGKYILAAGTAKVVKINILTGKIETLANNPWHGSSAIFGGIAENLNKVY